MSRMPRRHRNIVFILCFACAGLLLGCLPDEEPALDAAVVKHDLLVLARARVLFAHQSVGRNILEGVHELSMRAGVPVRIEALGESNASGPGLFHVLIGRNADPDGKLRDFAALLSDRDASHYDVAMIKFCYEDFGRDSRAAPGFAGRYLEQIQQLQSRRPDVLLVHSTAPLRADPPGWRPRIDRLLARRSGEDEDQLARNAYNDVLRASPASVRLFDLAEVEATLPDGSRSSFTLDGRRIDTLWSGYSSDGAHLNEAGRTRAAAAFVHALASALEPATP